MTWHAATHRLRCLSESFGARAALVGVIGLAASAVVPASAAAVVTGTIEGTVKGGPTEVPLEKAHVCPWLQTSPGHYEEPEESQCATTSNTGKYTLVVPVGTYVLSFVGPGSGQPAAGAHTYVTRYSGEKSSLKTATTVEVKSSPAVVSNALLEEGGWITGTVTNGRTHTGAEGVLVCIAHQIGTEEYETIACSGTESGGKYALWGVPERNGYIIGFISFSEGGLEIWFYNGAPVGGAPSASLASLIDVHKGIQTENINTTFLGPAPPPPPPPPPSPPPITTTSTATSSTTTSSSASGTASGPGSATVKNGIAAIPLHCGGSGPCNGTLKLLAHEKHKVKRRGKTVNVSRTVVIGEHGFSIGAGGSATVAVHLTANGMKLLHNGGKKLTVTLSGSDVQGGTLVLKEAAKHGGKK
jgi:hypothetical protein